MKLINFIIAAGQDSNNLASDKLLQPFRLKSKNLDKNQVIVDNVKGNTKKVELLYFSFLKIMNLLYWTIYHPVRLGSSCVIFIYQRSACLAMHQPADHPAGNLHTANFMAGKS